jgi:hypothetical protein
MIWSRTKFLSAIFRWDRSTERGEGSGDKPERFADSVP